MVWLAVRQTAAAPVRCLTCLEHSAVISSRCTLVVTRFNLVFVSLAAAAAGPMICVCVICRRLGAVAAGVAA